MVVFLVLAPVVVRHSIFSLLTLCWVVCSLIIIWWVIWTFRFCTFFTIGRWFLLVLIGRLEGNIVNDMMKEGCKLR